MANEEQSTKSFSVCDQIFNKVLDTLEHYVDTPIEQHFCMDCGDKFIFRSSYMDHIFRDSLNIVYDCNICKAKYKFSNRCSLINHLRNHMNVTKSFTMVNISVEPSPSHLVTITENYEADEETVSLETFKMLKESNLIQITDDIPPVTTSSLFFETINNTAPNVDNMIEKINRSFDLAIEECEADYKSMDLDKSLDIHGQDDAINTEGCVMQIEMVPQQSFIRHSVLPSQITQTKDNQVCNNQQSDSVVHKAQASLGLEHDQPSCQDSQTDSHCMFCLSQYSSSTATSLQKIARHRHFQVNTSDLFICEKCNMYFRNPCSLKAHQAMHSLQPPFVCPECGFVMFKVHLYYKHVLGYCYHLLRTRNSNCPVEHCDTAVPVSLITEHFMNAHVKRFIKCPVCSIKIIKKNDFPLHMEKVHQLTYNQSIDYQYICHHCFTTFETSKDLLNHIQNIDKECVRERFIFYRCPGCRSMFPHITAIRLHTKKCIPYFSSNYAKHLRKIYCVSNRKTITSTDLLPNFIKKLCKNCKLAYIYNHPATDDTELTYCLKCSMDYKPLVLSKIISDKKLPRIKEWISKRKDQSPSVSPTKPKKKRRMKWGKKMSGEGIDANICEAGISIFKSQNNNGELKCAKCEFTSKDRDIFREHVISHRVPSATCQCMDCGMCFVTKHSLSSHLIISHSVTDAEKYIDDNKCITDAFVDVLNEEQTNAPTVNENQCEVCMDQFQNSADLNKHFRIHGMAFILAKQKNKIA